MTDLLTKKRHLLTTLLDSALAGLRDSDIAVIGIGGRYPAAATLDELWSNLRRGHDATGDVPRDRFDPTPWYSPETHKEAHLYTARGGFIADADKFDPLFFNISPREAESMDPQERVFLEVAWAALEDAGRPPAGLEQSRVGVFVGAMNHGYASLGATAWARGVPTGARTAFWSIANRLSYVCNFRGPSLAVDTACSSSLTAVHLACESLRRGECDLALAGGVNIIVHPLQFIGLCSLGMLSPTGRCSAFGAAADGFVDGEGAGALLLKPLPRAVADRDNIWGVLRGSSLTAGGKTAGYTVPNPDEQAACVREALARAHVDPRTISYVEAHGTGTALGDPIEIAALNRVFGRADVPTCTVGSVKANVGHLESAAGVCGLTRVLLQLRHATIAPSIHSQPINPRLALAGSALRLALHPEPWHRPILDGHEVPRRAGVSSFGAGGANAHIILEELRDPLVALELPAPPPYLLVLSARDDERRHALARRHLDFLRGHASPLDLGRLCHTLQVGREPMAVRLAVVGHDLDTLAAGLAAFLAAAPHPHVFHGHGRRDRQRLAALPPPPPLAPGLDLPALARCAEHWALGGDLPWSDLYGPLPPRRMSLPTYPFARESSWVDPRALAGLPAPAARHLPLPTTAAEPTLAEPSDAIPMPTSAISPTTAAEPTLAEPHPAPAAHTPPPDTAPLPAADPRHRDLHPHDLSVQTDDRPARITAATALLRTLVADTLHVPAARIDPHETLDIYGVDSVSALALSRALATHVGEVPRTLFLELPTIAELAAHLADHHPTAFPAPLAQPARSPAEPTPSHRSDSLLPLSEPTTRSARSTSPAPSAPLPEQPSSTPEPATRSATQTDPTPPRSWSATPSIPNAPTRPDPDAIAIIGMSARFPGAPDLATFADNLRHGRSALTEVPPARWTARTPTWGGFLDDIDRFDHALFNISAVEAAAMDPAERLFLEIAWQTLEHAGYPRVRRLASQRRTALGTGVFAGCMYHQYPHLAATAEARALLSISSHWSLANRVSWFFDLQGPSVALDNACAAGLTAVHQACRALRDGECAMALAGAVNLSLLPQKYTGLQLSGLLTTGSAPRLFGDGDGFLPGEGVAALLLKPLAQAEADGDRILAVVRATRVNHGGRTSGFTVPGVRAQTDLVTAALARTGLATADIDYLELAANGSAIGDAVELRALSRAFAHAAPASIPVGSTKAALGHLEAAAGLAQIIKVVLQMHHGALFPSLPSDAQTTAFPTTSPFRLVPTAEPWPAHPARAGIHSFGAGGSNAFLLLESHASTHHRHASAPRPAADDAQLFLFSAATPDQLHAWISRLTAHLAAHTPPLADLAHTLQIGRERHPHRLALAADDLPTLLNLLTRWLTGDVDPCIAAGQALTEDPLLDGPEGEAFLRIVLAQRRLEKLARLWVRGIEADWSALHPHRRPTIVDLPAYPFARTRCWLQGAPEPAAPPPARAAPSESTLRTLLSDILTVPPDALDPQRDLADYGVNSMLGTFVMLGIRDRFNVDLPLHTLRESPTLAALTARVQASTPTPDTDAPALPPELLRIQRGAQALSSFWVHGAPGFAQIFTELPPILGPDLPIYAFQARGLDGAHPPFASFDTMVEHYLAALQRARPAGPYLLGGYSLGGLIAHEMARRLLARGAAVTALVMFDTYPAGPELDMPEHTWKLMVADMFLSEGRLPADALVGVPPALHDSHLADLLVRDGRTILPPGLVYTYLRGAFTVSAHHREALRHHKPSRLDSVPVLYFRAARSLDRRPQSPSERTRRARFWQTHTARALRIVDLDADHSDLLASKHHPRLRAELTRLLAETADVSCYGATPAPSHAAGAGPSNTVDDPAGAPSMTSNLSIPEFHYDPMAPGMDDDPSATYAALREQPIFHWPVFDFYIVARFADVQALLRNPSLTTDPVAAGHPAPEAMLPDELRRPIENSLTRLPPASHARVRRAVSPSFTPRAVERLSHDIQTIVDTAIERFVVGGVLDVPGFTGYIPLRVIATLLDIPAEHDDGFRRFADALVHLHDPRMTPELFAQIAPPALAGVELIRRLIADRREHLGEDLLSTVIRAEAVGDGVSEDEMVGLVAMLINGGMLTTMHFLQFAIKSLLCVPERLAPVLADPSILPNALEEVLRFDSFGKSGTLRFVAEDTEVAGVTLPRGSRVLGFFPAAYLDPAAFPHADQFDPARKPADNLNYGHGPHFCLGTALARREGDLAIRTLITRFKNFRILGAPVWVPNPLVRELGKLDVAVEPR